MSAANKPKITLWEFFQSLGKTFMLPVALLSSVASCGDRQLAEQPRRDHSDAVYRPPDFPADLYLDEQGRFLRLQLPAGDVRHRHSAGHGARKQGRRRLLRLRRLRRAESGHHFYLTAAGVLPTGDPLVLKANNIQNILGIQSIDTGILGAVIVGIIVYRLHERFHTIRLPDALAFFGGTRFVPIVTTVVLGLCGLVIPLIWPWFAAGITGLGWVINSAGAFGPMLFGTGERLLLPFGLQHILVALIRFTEAGGTMEVCGHSVSGALTIFQAQLSCPTTTGFAESATRFLSQGKMPAFLGGLPGAALAMYHCAKPENRHKIKGLLISGVVACVVGGTTEPIEFLFLFVAPFLYLIHALLTGLGFTVMALLGVTIGNTDGNIIDFVVFGILHGTATKWYLVPVVAAVWFVGYYAIFRFAIQRFNIKTPGRESDSAVSQSAGRRGGQIRLQRAGNFGGARRPGQHHHAGQLHHPPAPVGQ